MKAIIRKLTLLSVAVALLMGASVTNAITIPTEYLLVTENATATINGATFVQTDPQPVGTGVIDPFLRLGANTDYEQGYNTSARDPNKPPGGTEFEYDQKEPINYTHDLLLSDVPIVTLADGIDYRQFLLDINQNKSASAGGEFLSLDVLQFYLRATAFTSADIVNNVYPSLGTQIWDLGNNYLKLNYELNPGSGAGDMFAYIPNSLFSLAGSSDPYVYLFSGFGANYANNDGYEEWWVETGSPPVPEPGTMMLLGVGLFGLAVYGKRRMTN